MGELTLKSRATTSRVEHIDLSFGEAVSVVSAIDRRALDRGAMRFNLVKGRVYADSVEDGVTGELLYRLVGYFLEAHPPKEIRYRYPLTWWDHFKEACFPVWALTRWPVIYRTETTVIKDIYPFPNVDLGECLGPVYRIAHRSSLVGMSDGEEDPAGTEQ